MKQKLLEFGLNDALPLGLTAAWGARWIFPDDMVWDRQSFIGHDTEAGQKLKKWLNGTEAKPGALKRAQETARKLSAQYVITPRDTNTVTLAEDKIGIIKADPRSSYGYLYVCAYLKEEAING